MSFKRPQIHRCDASTQQIVDEPRALHYTVIHVGRPTDLLVRHPSWPINSWRLLECKTPKGKKRVLKLRKDQQEQQDFCADHFVPYVLDGLSAVTYLEANRL